LTLTLTLTESSSATTPWPATASRSASWSTGSRHVNGHAAERVAVAGHVDDHVGADVNVIVNVDVRANYSDNRGCWPLASDTISSGLSARS
jgi:hypothetical protein